MCVAACCRVLQRVAVCYSVLHVLHVLHVLQCCVVLQRCNVFFVRVDANYTASMCPTGDSVG